jgi:hypothetical protein
MRILRSTVAGLQGLLLMSLGAFSLACGSGSAGVDDGFPSTIYPAFALDAPQVVRGDAGAVMASPTARLNTFPGYPLQTQVTQVLAQIQEPSYWATTTREYGVGPLTIGPPIATTEAAPASVDASAIEAWLAAMLDGANPDFGAADESTIYVLVYPTSTTLVWSSQPSCGGFHDSVAADGTRIHYAALADCANPSGQQAEIDALGSAMSHELIETATDPDFVTPASSGYSGIDSDHLAWQYFLGTSTGVPLGVVEVCDLCLMEQATLTGTSHAAATAWSNGAIRAGRDPCVPAVEGEPYFNAMPVLPDEVEFSRPPLATVRTKGVLVPSGESRTIEIDLYSNGKMARPWSVSVFGQGPGSTIFAGGPGPDAGLSLDLRVSLDRSSGVNGQKLHLTITRLRDVAEGSSVLGVDSRSATDDHYWPFVVGQ